MLLDRSKECSVIKQCKLLNCSWVLTLTVQQRHMLHCMIYNCNTDDKIVGLLYHLNGSPSIDQCYSGKDGIRTGDWLTDYIEYHS